MGGSEGWRLVRERERIKESRGGKEGGREREEGGKMVEKERIVYDQVL